MKSSVVLVVSFVLLGVTPVIAQAFPWEQEPEKPKVVDGDGKSGGTALPWESGTTPTPSRGDDGHSSDSKKDEPLPWEQTPAKSEPERKVPSVSDDKASGPGYAVLKGDRELDTATLARQADMGDPDSMYELAMRHYFGRTGVKKDYSKALPLLRELANLGYAQAQYRMGFCYRFGRAVKADAGKAFDWFLKSAHQGYKSSEFEVGEAYFYGRSVEKDLDRALAWHLQAYSHGETRSLDSVGDIYFRDSSKPDHLKKAVEWYRKGVAADQSDAAFSLGFCAEKGKGMVVDPVFAFECYKKSAYNKKSPYASGMSAVGGCYELGIGTPVNHEQAFEHYKRAADMGYAHAVYRVGRCYERGVYVSKDYDEAIAWYQKAKAKGDTSAEKGIARCEALKEKSFEQDLDDAVDAIDDLIEIIDVLTD